MEELHEAGLATRPLSDIPGGAAAPGRHVVVTFDDGFRNVFENALPVMTALGFHATQFLTRAASIMEPREKKQNQAQAGARRL